MKIDTQVWSSNPAAGGRKTWISGDHDDFKTYNFVIPLPDIEGMDYVRWELVIRSPGQIIVDDVQCRYFYGKPYDLDIIGSQTFSGSQLTLEQFTNAAQTNVTRWVRYLKTVDIACRKGLLIIADSSGAMRGAAINQDLADKPVVSGFMLKLRREGDTVEDVIDTLGMYSTEIRLGQYVSYTETRQQRARYSYDRVQLVAYIEPHRRSTDTTWGPDEIGFVDAKIDLPIANFVGPSQ